MHSFAIFCASIFVMGVSILTKLWLRDFNSMGCDTPAFSSPVSSSSLALSAPGVSSAAGFVGTEFPLRHSSHQTGAVFFVPADFFHFSKGV
jgi:hypothetical protein